MNASNDDCKGEIECHRGKLNIDATCVPIVDCLNTGLTCLAS